MLAAVSSAWSADELKVEAPERMVTEGHSKFIGSASAAAALASPAAVPEPNIDEKGKDDSDGDEQAPRSGLSSASATAPRRTDRNESLDKGRNSVTLPHPYPVRRIM